MTSSTFGELDVHLAREGRHERLYEKLGAHVGSEGVTFAVWAPTAQHVSLVGDFNGWDPTATPMQNIGDAVKSRMDQLEFERDQLTHYLHGQ